MKALFTLLALSSATVGLAATDFERFDKRVGKYATVLGGEPKGLCLCQDGTPLGRGIGFLLRGSADPGLDPGSVMLMVGCHVPVFDETTGELRAQAICEQFVPLAK